MTHRDPAHHLESDKPRCEPATMRYGCTASTCARYLAPIDGAPLGDLYAMGTNGTCVMHEPLKRRPATQPAPRKVHPPLGSEQC